MHNKKILYHLYTHYITCEDNLKVGRDVLKKESESFLFLYATYLKKEDEKIVV